MTTKPFALIPVLAAAAILAFAPMPAGAAANAAAPANAENIYAQPGKTLNFFMNPYGVPCQIQDRILTQMAPDLKGKAAVKYFKTNEPGDRPQFSSYGVRGLPYLVIVDRDGHVVHRFSPGIQSKAKILAALGRK